MQLGGTGTGRTGRNWEELEEKRFDLIFTTETQRHRGAQRAKRQKEMGSQGTEWEN